MSLILTWVICGITTVVLFALAWVICVRIKNYGFLDAVWTLCIGGLALFCGAVGSGSTQRRVAFTTLGVAWSARLGLFVLVRVWRHHPTEDRRYASFRKRWKSPGGFLLFFELQAAAAVLFAAPFLSASFATSPQMGIVEWVGLLTALIGITGEAVADGQAAAFKRRQNRQSPVLNTGLWRYSRHPNYFFELVVWIGFALAAATLPWGWIGLVCPALMAYFLLRVTGIPLTEKYSLEAHGQAYRDYQHRTSAFVPWISKGVGR